MEDFKDITNGIPFEPWSKNNSYRCYDLSLCPVCGRKLTMMYEGLACKHPDCRLYFKLERGWVYLNEDSKLSGKKNVANIFFSSSTRLRLDKLWIEVKRKVLIRDDYKCVKCNAKFDTWNCYPLHVHHIIPASEEMALYLDEDNLITLCEKCHNEVHQFDKYKFGGKNGTN
jgi:hypothetical protein